MPSSRTWTRTWAIWVISFASSGTFLDLAAYVFGGYHCTLTCHVRTWAQIEPEGRYGRLGRVGVVGFLLWAAAHLGWGVLDPIPRQWSPVYKREFSPLPSPRPRDRGFASLGVGDSHHEKVAS
jgi:hypothetical protein